MARSERFYTGAWQKHLESLPFEAIFQRVEELLALQPLRINLENRTAPLNHKMTIAAQWQGKIWLGLSLVVLLASLILMALKKA